MLSVARRVLGPGLYALAVQFFRFGLVGTSGMVVDTAVVYAARGWLGVIGAGALSYPVAASWTFWLNRRFTFRDGAAGTVHAQWARFLMVNLVGLVFNRGTYAALVSWSPYVHDNPVLAVAAGGFAGMFWNFALSRRLVFRPA